MYLWNIRALKRDLIASALPESQLFGYFLAVLMFEATAWQSISLFPSATESGLWDYLGTIGALLLTLGGTVIAYRLNGAAQGRHFLGRYFPLVWVLTLRFLAGVIPLMTVLIAVLAVADGWFIESESGAPEDAGIAIAVTVATWSVTALFYFRLAVHVRDVARVPEPGLHAARRYNAVFGLW